MRRSVCRPVKILPVSPIASNGHRPVKSERDNFPNLSLRLVELVETSRKPSLRPCSFVVMNSAHAPFSVSATVESVMIEALALTDTALHIGALGRRLDVSVSESSLRRPVAVVLVGIVACRGHRASNT